VLRVDRLLLFVFFGGFRERTALERERARGIRPLKVEGYILTARTEYHHNNIP